MAIWVKPSQAMGFAIVYFGLACTPPQTSRVDHFNKRVHLRGEASGKVLVSGDFSLADLDEIVRLVKGRSQFPVSAIVQQLDGTVRVSTGIGSTPLSGCGMDLWFQRQGTRWIILNSTMWVS